MNDQTVRPRLEELEERAAPTASDVVNFAQNQLPGLQAQFNQLVPVVQAQFQQNLNTVKALATAQLPASDKPALDIIFAQYQAAINAFPAYANGLFAQAVATQEVQLFQQPAPPAGGVTPTTGGTTQPTSPPPAPPPSPPPSPLPSTTPLAPMTAHRPGAGLFVTTTSITI